MDRLKKIVTIIDDHPSIIGPEMQIEGIERVLGMETFNKSEHLMLKFDEIETVKKLIMILEEKKATHIVCFRLTVLRSLVSSFWELSEFIANIKEHHMEFICVKEHINTEDDLDIFLKNLTQGWKAERLTYKSENAKISQMKAIERGSPLGRPKKRDDEKIVSLRRTGLSIRDIAARTGVSTAAVQRALKSTDV